MRNGPGRAPAVLPERREVSHEVVREYEFLTPVFGGGVTIDGAKKHYDPVTPIRAASIRGQLRFWWRACNPQGCQKPSELRAAEEKIFGSVTEPSRLLVEVVQQPTRYESVTVLKGKFDAAPGMTEIAYGAFPLRSDSENGHGYLHRDSGHWKMRFRLLDMDTMHQVEAALWAFAHFGGIGGRTRRGFGAIAEVGHPSPSIRDGWKRYVSAVRVTWPHLPAWHEDRPPVLFHPNAKWTASDGLEAQKYLLHKLRSLRQGPRARKDGDSRHPGRSFWPEPDEIRRLTRCHGHEPAHPVRKFPRAAFGLPIVFHFKGERDGEPPQTMLVPRTQDDGKARNRWASPLILRPHRGPEGMEALALFLLPSVGDELELLGRREGESWPVQRVLSAEEARVIKPLGDRAEDPLERFREIFHE